MRDGPQYSTEFQGEVEIIVPAAYGLKYEGADYFNHMRDCMSHIGYTSCPANPDVWM